MVDTRSYLFIKMRN